MSSRLQIHDPALPQGRAALLAALQAGRVLALPTETVPGLAVLADNPAGRRQLAELKGAPASRPYTLHLRGMHDLRALVPSPPPGLGAWMSRRMPGPLTVVLPADWVALPKDWRWEWPAVGLRVPRHPVFQDLASLLHAPLLMSSINPHGLAPLRGTELAAWLAARPHVAVGFDPLRVPVGEASAVAAFEPLPRLLRGSLVGKDRLPGQRVLVLCSGNICRSPLAAALLERELASAWGVRVPDLQELGWVVASAGTFAVADVPASESTVQAGAEIGLDLARHRAQHVEEALRHPWDMILAMGANHLQAVPSGVAADLFDPRGLEVPDPFGCDLAAYRLVRDQLSRAAEERVASWCRWPER
ncbi:MAG: hypothetical protein EYC70_03875 [Planctomycetota bacterium]|nr:MAG: hypothetical protein EYC70_03875 [Planctomycetota bacterium]